jgi:hypothetical protein
MNLQDHIKAENAKTQAWVNEDPKNRCAGMIVEDLSHWASSGVHTVEQYEHYMLDCVFSDIHKDAYGIRPRAVDYWNKMSISEKQKEIDSLVEIANEVAEEEHQTILADVKVFEKLVDHTISMGAGNRTVALRWIAQSDDDYQNGCFSTSQFLHDNGILFWEGAKKLEAEINDSLIEENIQSSIHA